MQTEQIIPQFSAKNNFSVKNGDDYTAMEERINEAIKIHNVSYLEFLRDVAVSCDQFIFFVREKSFGPDWDTWPQICGKIFSNVPILSPAGTCYTTHPDYEKKLNLYSSMMILRLSYRTFSYGVTEKITLLLSSYVEILKSPEWLIDESLRGNENKKISFIFTLKIIL